MLSALNQVINLGVFNDEQVEKMKIGKSNQGNTHAFIFDASGKVKYSHAFKAELESWFNSSPSRNAYIELSKKILQLYHENEGMSLNVFTNSHAARHLGKWLSDVISACSLSINAGTEEPSSAKELIEQIEVVISYTLDGLMSDRELEVVLEKVSKKLEELPSMYSEHKVRTIFNLFLAKVSDPQILSLNVVLGFLLAIGQFTVQHANTVKTNYEQESHPSSLETCTTNKYMSYKRKFNLD